MTILALEAWAAANRDYNNDPGPQWHTKAIPDTFTAVSGLLWSISYILMARQAFKDRSYAMPLHCLCLNITWEAVYGFIYGPGLINQVVFAQWMIVDVVLFYAIIRSAPDAWSQSPLVARHLLGIIVAGCALCLWLHLAVAATFIPFIGRQVVFMTAWPMQLLINVSSIAQLLSRGNTRGHSWGIWWTRMLGTIAAACCFFWRVHYWPERFGYAWTPYGRFLLLGSIAFDLLYAVVYVFVQGQEGRLDSPVNDKKKSH
ncbi:terpene cyclase spyD [Aspergillus stella-maris]|uniref:terpene cyclase spyD n=1 Tax=Aspergillus stella-maris TaxID=1810926 RepID=UPI003CCD9293